MDLVVNEWLPEYFLPEASTEEKKSLETFLNRFLERNDRLVVKKPSPFLDKIYRYAKDYQRMDEIVQPIRTFIKLILLDSNRCKFLSEEEIEELPTSVLEKLEVGNYGSDQYLFESATAINGEKIIVTTDEKLIVHFAGEDFCELALLDNFLESY